VRQFIRSRRFLAVGGALVVLAATAAGVSVVQAQATPTPQAQNQTQNPRERFLAALATRLNIPVDRLKQAMQDARNDVGLNRPHGQGQGQGHGPGGKRGGFGSSPMRGLLAEEADAVAPLFGLDRQGLINELRGKTLAEVAGAHNVPVQTVINTIVQTANARVDRMAQQRNLSADQVNQIKQRISQQVTDLVNTHRFQDRQNRRAPTTRS
jgi:hypothetical protein